MRWDKKGHQFDEIASVFKEVNTIAIYGMGQIGKEIVNILDVMSFSEKYSLKYYDQKYREIKTQVVEAPVDMLACENRKTMFIIAVGDISVQLRITKILLSKGYSQNLIYTGYEFLDYILPIFTAYNLDKLYFHSLQISIGDICNLRCRDCINFIPYMQKRINRKYEEICADIDFLFEKVTYIRYLPILGGESFLHPKLEQIVYYILVNYGNRISKLQIYTNGTISKFSKSLLELFRENRDKIWIYVSNYTYSNPQLTLEFDIFIDMLKENDIPYYYEDNFIWNDTGIRNLSYIDHTDLEEFVTTCSPPCRDYQDGKLFYCGNAKFAAKVFQIEDKNNYLNLKIENNVIAITEFMQGFLKDGYLEICKICNGYDEMTNSKLVDAGIQIDNKE